MSIADVPEVVRIDRLSFARPWPERTYQYEIEENPASHLLVAEPAEEGRPIVGYLGYWLIIDEMHISTLAVDPDHRRMGIADDLLEGALDRAAEQGGRLATLEVRESNVAAIQLYRKHAFEVVGRRARYYRDDGEDAILMTRLDLRSRKAP
jgi:ribosomal-protein-alanine N-acetyltransferase